MLSGKNTPFPKLIILGLIIFLAGTLLRFEAYLPTQQTAYTYRSPQEPQKIIITSLDIDSRITEGGIENNDWILKDDSVLFLPGSGLIGEGFNTVLYAYKRPDLFLNLSKIDQGDFIEVQDAANKKFFYTVYSIETIKPEDLDKLKSELPNNLTLFTCDGILDTERLLVKAKPYSSTEELKLGWQPIRPLTPSLFGKPF